MGTTTPRAEPGPRLSDEDEQLAGTFQMFTRRSPSDVDQTGALLFDENIALVPQPTASPNDPLNWSPWRKYWHAALVLYVTALTAAVSNDAGAAGDGMLNDLDISYDVQNTAAGVLFVGIGYWTLLASPMPWLYGRRLQYLVCLLCAVGGSIWFARIQNQNDTVWNQLFVGASEACAEALAQLSLSDLFFQHQRGSVLGLYILATSIGTFLGPLVAGYIYDGAGWRWIGWTGAIISGATLLIFYFGLEETAFNREAVVQAQGDLTPAQSNTEAGNGTGEDEKSVQHQPPTLATVRTGLKTGDIEAPGATDPKKPYRQRIQLITPAPNLKGLGFKQYFNRLMNSLRVFIFPAVIYSGLQWGAQE